MLLVAGWRAVNHQGSFAWWLALFDSVVTIQENAVCVPVCAWLCLATSAVGEPARGIAAVASVAPRQTAMVGAGDI